MRASAILERPGPVTTVQPRAIGMSVDRPLIPLSPVFMAIGRTLICDFLLTLTLLFSILNYERATLCYRNLYNMAESICTSAQLDGEVMQTVTERNGDGGILSCSSIISFCKTFICGNAE